MEIVRLAPFAALLALAGCSGLTTTWSLLSGASVGPQAAVIAANSFDELEAAATIYLKLPACVANGPAICRNAAAVAKIVPAVRAGRTARDGVETLLKDNAGANIPVASIDTLTSVNATLQSIYAEYDIKVGG